MRTKPAVTILAIASAISVAGCSVRDAADTSWMRPQEDIPTVGAIPASTDNPGAPDEPLVSGQSALPAEQVTSGTPANPPVPATKASLQTSPSRTTISFTPVIGAPIEAVRPLSRQLGSEARTRGIVILNSGDGTSNHILKGYFSAFTEGDKTTVGFVWDVLDASGSRLHRIRGQEIVQGTATDPWDVVQASTMETIAARTITDYLSWRSQAGG